MLRYMTGLQKNREDLNSMLVLRNVLERRGNFYGSGGGGGGGTGETTGSPLPVFKEAAVSYCARSGLGSASASPVELAGMKMN